MYEFHESRQSKNSFIFSQFANISNQIPNHLVDGISSQSHFVDGSLSSRCWWDHVEPSTTMNYQNIRLLDCRYDLRVYWAFRQMKYVFFYVNVSEILIPSSERILLIAIWAVNDIKHSKKKTWKNNDYFVNLKPSFYELLAWLISLWDVDMCLMSTWHPFWYWLLSGFAIHAVILRPIAGNIAHIFQQC